MEKVNKPSFLTLFFLISFPSTCSVFFSPALPAMASFFNLSPAQSDLTISTFLFGYALGQLPFGPIANRFGRRKTLLIGLSIAAIGSLLCGLCAFFASFNLLLFARFLQAIGASASLKVTYTMIADSYDQTMATKMISRLGTSFAVVPAVAMIVGGYLTQYVSWESCFYFLAFCSLILILAVTKLPETQESTDPHALKIAQALRGYGQVLKSRQVISSGLIIGCGTAMSYIFNAKAPFLGIETLGLSPDQFGVYSQIPLLGMFLGAILSDRIAGKYPLLGTLLVGSFFSLLVCFVTLFLFSYHMLNVATLFAPMFLILIVDSVIYANVISFGLSRSENKSNGSAMINFIALSVVVLILSFFGRLSLGAEILMPLSFIVLFIVIVLLCFGLKGLVEEDVAEPEQ